MQQWNLYNDAIVGKAFYERFFIAVFHNVSVIVEYVVIDIYYRFLYIAHFVSQKVDSHHWVGKSFFVCFAYVVFVAVLRTEILTKSQSFGVEPCLL